MSLEGHAIGDCVLFSLNGRISCGYIRDVIVAPGFLAVYVVRKFDGQDVEVSEDLILHD